MAPVYSRQQLKCHLQILQWSGQEAHDEVEHDRQVANAPPPHPGERPPPAAVAQLPPWARLSSQPGLWVSFPTAGCHRPASTMGQALIPAWSVGVLPHRWLPSPSFRCGPRSRPSLVCGCPSEPTVLVLKLCSGELKKKVFESWFIMPREKKCKS